MATVMVAIDNFFVFEYEDEYTREEMEDMARESTLELIASLADDDFEFVFETEVQA